ncbi:hypothetical protein QPK87_31795 [Kamptonema cortianum]|nr:hypothetical protein [Kamptonema cortianum]
MSSCQEAIETLSNLSANDSGAGQEDHSWRVKEAISDCAVALIERASGIAVSAMRQGRSQQGLSICQAILESPLEDEWEERGLASLVAFAAEVCDEISLSTGEIEVWTPSWHDPLAQKVSFILALEKAFGRRHPGASRWRDVLCERREAVGILMRDYAIEAYNEKSDEAEAIRILNLIKVMDVSRKLKERIDDDFAQIAKNQSTGVPRIPALARISSAPAMSTAYGIGFMVFDVGTCNTNRLYKYSNHYFTFFFVPLFPLGRYLTQPTYEGKKFFGKLPWTAAMKIHLVAGLTIFLVGLYIIANSGNSSFSNEPDSYDTSFDSPYEPSASSSYPPSTGSDQYMVPSIADSTTNESASTGTETLSQGIDEQAEEQPPFDPVRLTNGKNILPPKGPFGLGYLTVKNKDGEADVVIILRDISSPESAYRFVYLRSSDSVTIDRIAPGTYEILIRQGIDWNNDELKFNRQESLSKMDDLMEFMETKTSSGTEYSTWSLELQERIGGNASSSPVFLDDFPKK